MRRLVLGAILAFATAAVPTIASAQQIRNIPELPRLSPAASVTQRVGLTDMSIEYSSPAARERVVWGELVPYGEPWRAGANAPTRFTASTDFTFGGTEVPAGTYTLLVVPNESEWAFHLNTDSSGAGVFGYDASEDVAVATVSPVEGPERERLTFLFTDTTDNGTHLTLEWAGMMAAVPVEVDTEGMALASIEAELAAAWRPAYSAGRYYYDSGQDMEMAAVWMGQSIGIQENAWNHWFMAAILAEQGDYASAREHAQTAVDLADGDDVFTEFYLPRVEEALSTWPES